MDINRLLLFFSIFYSTTSILTDEKKALITGLSTLANRVDVAEVARNKCPIILDFNKYIKATIFEESYGRHLFYNTYNKIFRNPFTTKSMVQKEYTAFKNKLDLGDGDKFCVNLAIGLSAIFNSNDMCMGQGNVMVFVYKFMELSLCEDPELFLTALMENIDEEMKLSFIMYHTVLFVQTDEKLELDLQERFKKDPKTVVEQFISLYMYIIQLKNDHNKQYVKDKISGTIDKGLKAGGALLTVYGAYQLRSWCFDYKSAASKYINKFAFFEFGLASLVALKKYFARIDKEKTIHDVPHFFDIHTNIRYKSTPVTEVGDGIQQRAYAYHANYGIIGPELANDENQRLVI